MSGDGRTMAYTGAYHIFVVDVPTMVSRAVTTTSFPGVVPNAESLEPVLSRDGSFVVFASRASNLGIGIRDFDGGRRETWTAYGVELGLDRVEPISIAGSPSQVQFLEKESRLLVSGDGRRVAFQALSNASSAPDAALGGAVAILRDRSTDVATRLGGVGAPLALSEDGSTTVVVRDHGHCDAYRDGVIVGTSPVSGTTASADGSKIAGMNSVQGFTSVVVSLWDVASGQTTRVSRSASMGGVPNGDSERPEISRDGLFVAFESRAGDLLPGAPFSGGQANVYLYDVANDSVQLVSRTSASVPPVGETRLGPGRVLSRDGRYLVMTTKASSLGGLSLPAGGSHIVLYDRVLDVFSLVGGPEPSDLPNAGLASMDAAGRFIVFRRYGQMGNTYTSSLFVFDRQSGLSEEIVARLSGDQPRDVGVEISADGSTIAFSRLVTESSPSAPASAQAYVFDRRTRRTTLASHGATGADPGNGHSMVAALDSTGDVLVFRSSSSNLGVDLGFTVGGQQDERGGRQEGAFALLAPPIVYGVAPVCASTSGGRTVTIEGAHFKPGSTVTLDGIPATVTNVTSTAITVVTGPRAPTKARTGNVEVRSPNGEYDVLGNAFTYAIRGDANDSGALTAADGLYLKMALFLGGPQPATLCNGDANGSGATTAADSFFLNLYLFLGGAPPPP